MTIHITPANAGRHMLFGADVVTIKAAGEATAGSMLVLENRVLPGGGPPMLHRHAYSEVFYFLAGTFEVSTLNENNHLQVYVVHAGDTVAIPSMAWHNFKNIGAVNGSFLVVHTPPVMEALIEEIGIPIDDPLHPPVPAGPPSYDEQQRLMRLLGKYMEMLPRTQ